ncbi:hypothetical protein HHI36_012058 [Cryptolaemus montrouzieri]|uniref:SAM domain-containing protein n=1 Tax=Cryptolaemus montrouzieri TaxID=559131 RepID=A0ABD2ND68_9CUCU
MDHHPDFSSTEDEFEDDYEYQEFIREQRKLRQGHRIHLTEQQKKEQRIKEFYLNLMNGRVEQVLSELDNGLDVNQKLQNDWTPILVAASVANYNLVKELCKRGADVKSSRDGHTTLMLACNCPETTTPFEESCKVIELLLDMGVNPKIINRKRMTALMFAANNGNLEALELLFPVSDCKAEDNQNWNVLFWAVNSGKVKAVEYLVNKGVPFDKADVRGNTPLDLARENGFDEIIDLFSPEEDDEDFIIDNYKNDFESLFTDLKKGEKPQFFLDIYRMLNGVRCENLIRLFADREVNLLEFLSSTEDDLKKLGVQMPFQRKRLMAGIYRFHKNAFHPKSLPTIGKNELYSNMDAAAAILSSVKQMVTMEASLRYLMKNSSDLTLFSDDKEIRKAVFNIERQLKGLKVVVYKLNKKAIEWDTEIQSVNILTNKSGKRWFPWRKVIYILV